MKKIKPIFKLLFVLILLLIFMIYLFNKDKSYNIKYTIDGFTIYEEFNDKKDIYEVETTYEDKTYELEFTSNYLSKKIINKVNAYSNDTSSCIEFKSKQETLYPVCYSNNELTAYYLISDMEFDTKEVKYVNSKYNNIKINTTLDKNICIWNYTGYLCINNDKVKEIKLFDKEYYKNLYSFKVDNYLILPDYSEEYNFDNFIVINMKNNSKKSIKLENEISYDFYVLGYKNNLVYLIDKKNLKEYTFNPKKGTLTDITKDGYGTYYTNGTWETVSMTKLVNNTYSFDNDDLILHTLSNNKVYINYNRSKDKTLVSSKKVTYLVSSSGDDVYYLSKGVLYSSNNTYGEIKLIENSEWNFNYENQIFIY